MADADQQFLGLGLHFADGGILGAVVRFNHDGPGEVLEFPTFDLADHGDIAADLHATTRAVETAIEIYRGRGLKKVGLKASEPMGLVQSGLSGGVCRRLYLQGSILEMLSRQGLRPRTFLKQALYAPLGLSVPTRSKGITLDALRKDQPEAEAALGINFPTTSGGRARALGEARFMALAVAAAAARAQ